MSIAQKINSSLILSNLLILVSKRPVQRKIAQLIIILLIVYIAFISAKITWFVLSEPNSSKVLVAQSHAADKKDSNQSRFDISKLQALNLFGIYSEEEVEEKVEMVQDAPQTRLQLTLSGLVASDDVKTAAAIIEHKGKQETYGIGDLIVGTRASLERVLMDRVIIKQSGRLETLMLAGFDFKEPAKTISSRKNSSKKTSSKKLAEKKRDSKVLDYRNNKQLSNSAKALRADLNDNPGKITDYLRIMPKREKGKIVGYSLRPGKKPEFFQLSGLKTGDVAVQMNGFDLVIPSEAAQALAAMKKERDISLLIQRNGSLTEVLFSID